MDVLDLDRRLVSIVFLVYIFCSIFYLRLIVPSISISLELKR